MHRVPTICTTDWSSNTDDQLLSNPVHVPDTGEQYSNMLQFAAEKGLLQGPVRRQVAHAQKPNSWSRQKPFSRKGHG